MLKKSDGEFVSGEDMATKLNITRAGVWKHIKKLRDNGLDIIGKKNGYKINDSPDLLQPEKIQKNLNTKIIGKNIFYRPKVDSTNNIAKKMARENAVDGTVIIAEEQTNGKGRLERNFYSPKEKCILFSVILRPKCFPKDAPKFTLLAAVAVARAMEKFNLHAEIKWPNDIVHDGRKIVGILTELAAEVDFVKWIVVGVGINVNIKPEDFPEDIKNIASSLYEINGKKNLSRVDFFQTLLEEFEKIYLSANENGFGEILNLWKKYNVTLGKNIKVISADTGDVFFGKAIDIDSDGALIVETENGRQTVYAGDVSIRKAD